MKSHPKDWPPLLEAIDTRLKQILDGALARTPLVTGGTPMTPEDVAAMNAERDADIARGLCWPHP